MTKLTQPAASAFAVFFTLLAAITAGGGLALPVLLCLAGAVAIRPSLVRQAIENRPPALWLLLALTAWCIASTAWSPLPMDDQVYKLATMVPLGLMFVASATSDPLSRRLVAAGGLASAFVLLPLLGIEATLGMPLNQAAQPTESLFELSRIGGHGTTILLNLSWAGAATLIALGSAIRWAAALLLLGGAAALSTQFGQTANMVAFAVGLIVFAAAFIAPRLALLTTSFGLAALLLVAPFVLPLLFDNQALVDSLPFSSAHRTGIWHYIGNRTMEAPLFGHGLEASRAVTDHIIVQGREATATPLHPHNASLQLWYETGAIGVLLGAAALITGGLWLSRRLANDRPAAAAAAATLASMGVIANVSYGIWAEWWMATLFVSAAVVGAVRKA